MRGFDQTGSEEFLEPYARGRDAYERALADARGLRCDARGPPPAGRDGRRRRALAGPRHPGRRGGPRERPALAHGRGRARAQGADGPLPHGERPLPLARDRRRRPRRRPRARWASVLFVVIASLILLGGGLAVWSAPRAATSAGAGSRRSSSARSRARTTRPRPRTCSAATSSAWCPAPMRSCSAATRATASCSPRPTRRVAGLAERLDGAAPRDCLAVRRGDVYARRPRSSRSSRARSAATSRRVALHAVARRRRGHRLAARDPPQGLDPTRQGAVGAVNQAAPVLANLRNLAIAEHRAATDGLTGLPNARSVREMLLRMVAQAGGPARRSARSPWTSTASRRSTTAMATRPATRRSPPSAPSCAAACGRATSPAAGAGRSSSCSCPTRTAPAPSRWPRSCAS